MSNLPNTAMPASNNAIKAEILVQALPYLQQYFGKIIVVKYGGNAMIDDAIKNAVMEDIVLLSLVGIRVVLVHGGGPDITEMMEKLGTPTRFVAGLRYTDEQTIKVVQMVLAGKTNKDLTCRLQQSGGNAIGICGLDGGMIQATKRITEHDLGYVGDITKVDTRIITDQLNNGYIPVVATLGADEDGTVYNINADTAAAQIASSLGAENLILMTDIRGLLEDKDNPESLLPVVHISEVPALMNSGIISGGMIPKIDSCVEAVRRGVEKAFILDGRIPHAILIEMMTDEGVGTMLSK